MKCLPFIRVAVVMVSLHSNKALTKTATEFNCGCLNERELGAITCNRDTICSEFFSKMTRILFHSSPASDSFFFFSASYS